MHVGLDFGTTNTSAAVMDGPRPRLIPLDPVATNPAVMRTVLFIGRDGQRLVGQQALATYIMGSVGRAVIYEQRLLGHHTVVYAGTDQTNGQDVHFLTDLYAVVDANAPGRLFQSIKMSLADDYYAATDVFGTLWTVEELVAAVLSEIKSRIEQSTGELITSLTIGRPVHYGVTAEANDLARSRMRRACELAELPNVSFMPEPVAAAYAFAATLREASVALVFDFGGGTLDITIMRLDPSGVHVVLATDGVPIGGDRLDSRIVMGALLPFFGAGATLGPNRRPLPAFLLEQLAGWQQIMDLLTPRTIQVIDEAINTGDRPDELRALRALVSSNYGVSLYEEVERAKVRLSSETSTVVSLALDDIAFNQTIERAEFEALLGAELRGVAQCLDRVVEASGLQSSDIDVVLRTGGSSRIPRFVEILAERFGREKMREQDAFTSVAAGLALAGRRPTHLEPAGTMPAGM